MEHDSSFEEEQGIEYLGEIPGKQKKLVFNENLIRFNLIFRQPAWADEHIHGASSSEDEMERWEREQIRKAVGTKRVSSIH